MSDFSLSGGKGWLQTWAIQFTVLDRQHNCGHFKGACGILAGGGGALGWIFRFHTEVHLKILLHLKRPFTKNKAIFFEI